MIDMNTDMNDPKTNAQLSIRTNVMDAIRKGRVQMRPRWHFFLLSALVTTGILILLLTLLYIVSLSVFYLRDNGALFAPSFGMRGWFSLLHSIPWLLVVLIVVFLVSLEILARRFAFVYRKPLIASVCVIVMLVLAGGIALAATSFHRRMEFFARHNELPALLSFAYGSGLRPPPPPDAYYGTIASLTKDGFILYDENRSSTTTVIVTARTRLPYGANFDIGERVLMIGDQVATGTVEAFGVREADE